MVSPPRDMGLHSDIVVDQELDTLDLRISGDSDLVNAAFLQCRMSIF